MRLRVSADWAVNVAEIVFAPGCISFDLPLPSRAIYVLPQHAL